MEYQHIEEDIHKIVVFGASFGGISALIKILSDLDDDNNFAIIIVQHLKLTNEPTLLDKVLNRRSNVKVLMAQEGQKIQSGLAYVAQPGKHLIVKDGKLGFDHGNPVNHVKPASDVLFISAAKAYGNKVIGVVLTGTGKDGTKGCLMIKEKGGVTIAQDEQTSEFFAMPENAIKANSIDFILPLDKIAGKILDLTK
ncbi:MAG: Chemotaxis response regulator protein-glutamate methylesterase [Candidatus Magnetoglobus multicellularis str. Araruama]|uniref:protein-glutamate methylesterase n=1 Tax=Candidatus Magnetoglobus multicellularis str. Araruama TaxID=890399 RepID=A0A1V1PB80_9BACT|nr:MAG: Chemotaxis response regulator protein-glutamate methylesterase [Candidatus Magnetoglobus multicellularis str. Araruama]